MKVWISYLVDQLEGLEPECTFDLSEKTGAKVSLLQEYRPGDAPLRPDTLYLCLEGEPKQDLDIPEETYFLVDARRDEERLPRRIRLGKPIRQRALYRTLTDAFARYQNWLEELVRLSLMRAHPREYLQASEDILKNPVLIQDLSYSLIAISAGASREDYPFFDFGGTQAPTPEFLFQLQRDAHVLRHYATAGEGRYVVTHQEGMTELHYRMLSGGKPCANVTCAISRVKLTQGVLDLFEELCHYLRYTLDAYQQQTVPGDVANYALNQVLRFGNTRAMQSLLGPKEGWKFMVATLQAPLEDNTAASYLLRIQEMLPSSVAFLHQELISVVFCVNRTDTDAVFWQYQHQRLEMLANAIGGDFGLSYPMRELTVLGYGLQQAHKALTLPRHRKGEHRRLHFYVDVAIVDMLEGFFIEDTFEHFIPPEIAAIYQADARTGQRNCQLLYQYLLTGKSLAATSQALHLHRSTVVYRLDRLKERFNLRLDDPDRNQLYLLCCLGCQLREERMEEKTLEKNGKSTE